MKKMLLLSLCAALAVSMAACAEKNNEQSVVEEAPESSVAEIPLGESGENGQGTVNENEPFTFEPAASFSAEDANMRITVSLEHAQYTVEDLIPVYVTLTNHGDQTVAFAHGSGSMSVPSALELDLGGLVPLFYPEVMTMDFRMTTLEPGESLYLTCPYAPYRSADVDENAVFGDDKDLDFFREGNFIAAEPGEITGTYALTYEVIDADADSAELFMTDDDEAETITLSGEFTVMIGE